jgi:hypothetical protein
MDNFKIANDELVDDGRGSIIVHNNTQKEQS